MYVKYLLAGFERPKYIFGLLSLRRYCMHDILEIYDLQGVIAWVVLFQILVSERILFLQRKWLRSLYPLY